MQTIKVLREIINTRENVKLGKVTVLSGVRKYMGF